MLPAMIRFQVSLSRNRAAIPLRRALPLCLLAIAPLPAWTPGELAYEVVEGWGQFPEDHEPGAGMAVASDAQGAVWFYNRGSHPVVQFNSDGNLLQAWKENKERSLHQTAAHGMAIGPDGAIYAAETVNQRIQKFVPVN